MTKRLIVRGGVCTSRSNREVLFVRKKIKHYESETPNGTARMTRGAIAIIDALGFKGIWKREHPVAVLQMLKSLRRRGLVLQGGCDHSGTLVKEDGFRHRVRCMSDTIVVTVVMKERNAPDRGLYRAILSATMIAGDIMYNALTSSPSLLFRGCVATGEMRESSDFVIGPAVDEAAADFERADGPFLWLAKSAMDIPQRFAETFHDRLGPKIMIPYQVPLKSGKKIATQAFTYFCGGDDQQQRSATQSRVLTAFGQENCSINVRRKRHNTTLFLREIERIASSGACKCEPFRLPQWNDLTRSQRIVLLSRGIDPW